MGVRFLIGRSGSGKTKKYLDEIKQMCDENPQGNPIVVIVPDQMTFHLEYQLLKQSEQRALMRVQGLSFNRLAYRVLQETGGLVRYHLDKVGMAILLQKVMNEQKDELTMFKSFVNRPGFVTKMSEMISEFKSYRIAPEMLHQVGSMQELSKPSQKKLQDIAHLYEQFELLTTTNYLVGEDYYQLLIDQIANSQIIQQTEFYIDGYHLLNKQEEMILLQLAKYAKAVTIVLTHDLKSEASHFSLPRRTFDRLTTLFNEHKVSYEQQTLTPDVLPRFNAAKGLAHLEQSFLAIPIQTTEEDDVAFFHAPNRRLEVEEVAFRIHKLVHEQNVAFSDIAIYLNDENSYYDLIYSIFPTFNIPVFLDYKEKMIHHPLLSFLYHLLDVINHHWRYESLFTLIKTGLMQDVSNIESGAAYQKAYETYLTQLDLLENYCLSRHVTKKQWVSKEPFEYSRYQGLGRGYVKKDEDIALETLLNELRVQIGTPLAKFESDFSKAKTYLEKSEVLFTFIETLQIPKKLALLKEVAEIDQDLTKVKQHDQVWNKMLHLFEELVEVGQHEQVSVEDYQHILQAGILQMEYATVPPSLDQVYVGTCKRARYQLTQDLNEPGQFGIKHAFVLGVNEGQMPQTPKEISLLNETEREVLKENGIELAPTLEQTFEDELFILYTVFTSARQSLTLSYVSANDEGESFLASHVYVQTKEMFKAVDEYSLSRIKTSELYSQLTTPKQAVHLLIRELKGEKQDINSFEPLLNYFKTTDYHRYSLIIRALNYENETTPLTLEETKAIYTDEIVASVSRIELFNKCEFAHYVRYGLKAKEREQYKLELPHIGELYHEALKRIAVLIEKDHKSFADLTTDECYQLASMTSEELAEKLLYRILKQNRRMVMLKDKLIQVVYKTLVGLKYQASKSEYRPLFFELPFDTKTKQGIRVKSQPLPNGFKLSLKGAIDRIDVAHLNDEAYLRIIDYKSSVKDLELDKVYYGLSLQLLTYLDVAVSNALQLIKEPAHVGGLHYFHIHQPYTTDNKQDLLQVEDFEDNLDKTQMGDYKMTGYLPNDVGIVTLADTQLEQTNKSDVVPITLKTNGDFAQKGTKILTEPQFDLLRDYTQHKMVESATEITKGQIAINPISHKQEQACQYCDYRQICQFDPDFSGNNKRLLPKLNDERLFESIQNALVKGDEQDDTTQAESCDVE